MFAHDVGSIFYERGVHIDGKIIWIGMRDNKDIGVKQVVISFDVRNNMSSRHEPDIEEHGEPEHVCVVDDKLAVVFLCIVADDAVSSFLWLSSTDLFPVNEVNYTFVKQVDDMYQLPEFIGYHDDRFVFSNHYFKHVFFFGFK